MQSQILELRLSRHLLNHWAGLAVSPGPAIGKLRIIKLLCRKTSASRLRTGIRMSAISNWSSRTISSKESLLYVSLLLNVTMASYLPGDVAVIHPEILEERVEEILDILGWTDDADTAYTVRPTSEGRSYLSPQRFLC